MRSHDSFMNGKIKPGKSPLYILTLVAILVCFLGFVVFTILGIADFRSKEEKAEDHRQELINHSLFDDALHFGKKILENSDDLSNKDTVKRISCLSLPKTGTSKKSKKIVLIEYKNDHPSYCYSTTISNTYVLSPGIDYDAFKRQYKTHTELVLEDGDLDILFEEAEKILWH